MSLSQVPRADVHLGCHLHEGRHFTDCGTPTAQSRPHVLKAGLKCTSAREGGILKYSISPQESFTALTVLSCSDSQPFSSRGTQIHYRNSAAHQNIFFANLTKNRYDFDSFTPESYCCFGCCRFLVTWQSKGWHTADLKIAAVLQNFHPNFRNLSFGEIFFIHHYSSFSSKRLP